MGQCHWLSPISWKLRFHVSHWSKPRLKNLYQILGSTNLSHKLATSSQSRKRWLKVSRSWLHRGQRFEWGNPWENLSSLVINLPCASFHRNMRTWGGPLHFKLEGRQGSMRVLEYRHVGRFNRKITIRSMTPNRKIFLQRTRCLNTWNFVYNIIRKNTRKTLLVPITRNHIAAKSKIFLIHRNDINMLNQITQTWNPWIEPKPAAMPISSHLRNIAINQVPVFRDTTPHTRCIRTTLNLGDNQVPTTIFIPQHLNPPRVMLHHHIPSKWYDFGKYT